MACDADAILDDLPDRLRVLIVKAEKAMSGENYSYAKAIYQEIVNSFPDYIDGWYGLAKTHVLMGELSEGADCYVITKSLTPDFDPFNNFKTIFSIKPDYAAGFSQALAKREKTEDALRFIDYVMSTDPPVDLRVELLKHRDEIDNQHKIFEAQLYEAAKKKRHKEEVMWALSALLFFSLIISGFFLINFLFKFISSENLYSKGKINYQLGLIKLEDYKKTGLHLRDVNSYLNQAKVELEDAVRIDPDRAKYHLLLSQIYMTIREFEFTKRIKYQEFDEKKAAILLRDARLSLIRALECKPDYPEAHLELGFVYFEGFHWKQSIEHLNLAKQYAQQLSAKDEEQMNKIIIMADEKLEQIEKLREERYRDI